MRQIYVYVAHNAFKLSPTKSEVNKRKEGKNLRSAKGIGRISTRTNSEPPYGGNKSPYMASQLLRTHRCKSALKTRQINYYRPGHLSGQSTENQRGDLHEGKRRL